MCFFLWDKALRIGRTTTVLLCHALAVSFVYVPLQVFGFEVPAELPRVPSEVLNPREAWSDKAGYDATRIKLAGMFKDNYTKFVKVR